jgi:putative transposase
MKILCHPDNVSLLREAFGRVTKEHPFTIDAFVLLPEHLHCVWTLPAGDRDFSKRWRLIKSYFSRNCNSRHKSTPSASRQMKKERAVWQRRFWEHLIRNEQDFAKHVEHA